MQKTGDREDRISDSSVVKRYLTFKAISVDCYAFIIILSREEQVLDLACIYNIQMPNEEQ